MGHDIYGHKPSNRDEEIAYLRRGAFNPLNKAIYEALNAGDLYGGVSGIGERVFSKDALNAALIKLGDNDELSPEREFLQSCISNADDNGEILIDFS